MGETIKNTFEKVIPNIGASAAGGSIGAAMVKATKQMPPAQRLLSVGTASFVGAMGTRLGVETANSIIQNLDLKSQTKEVVDGDQIPSPVENLFINSPREITSPLDDLLLYQFSCNLLILILIISLLLVIWNRFVFKYNKEFITSIVDKYFSNKVKERYHNFINKNSIYNDRFLIFIFVINTIILIFLIILSLIISSELYINTEDYVQVYNLIHNTKK